MSFCKFGQSLSSSFIFSQDIITDRPDQTESPNTLNKGNLQIESGFLFSKVRENKKLVKIKQYHQFYLLPSEQT